MEPEPDGLPALRRSANALGVRVPTDIRPDADNVVHPATGGMSVAPDTLWNIPNHRRPVGLGRGSTGRTSDWIFGLTGLDVPPEKLTIRPDPARPEKHAFVEPSAAVPLPEFEEALARTRPAWSKRWP